MAHVAHDRGCRSHAKPSAQQAFLRLHEDANGAAAPTEREALAGRPSVNRHGKAGQPDDSPRLHLAQQRQLAQEHAHVIQRVEIILLAVRFAQVLLLLLAALADVDVVP